MRYLALIGVGLYCFLSTSLIQAQRSEEYNGAYALFYSAEELFEKQQYSSARKSFNEFYETSNLDENDPMFVKAKFYEGISALELYNNDAVKLLLQFNKTYPESIYKHQIYLKLGKYFYQKKKYTETTEWLAKVDLTEVDATEKDEYYFKLGYAHFQLGNFKKARNAFYEVKDGVTQYASPSLYYYAHISYQDKNYQTALEGFEKLLDVESFASVVPYYIAQIYYLQGKFDKVTEFAPKFKDSTKNTNQADLDHLIGDAYYKVHKYDEAVAYLENYAKKANTTREDDYQLGYAYYKSLSYDKAVKKFSRVSRKEDELGQVAMYHTGECYLKLENYQYARTAFESASKLDFSDKIQEDALYNYAILSYKLDYNPYNEAIEAFELYMERYPNSPRKNDVFQYLVNVYSSTKRYTQALDALDRLPKLDINLKTAYQVIAFNKGIELFERGDYTAAANALKLVNKYPVDDKINAEAKFWTADAYYRTRPLQKENMNKAIAAYRDFLKTPGNYTTSLTENAYYNIAYVYFDLEDYPQAITEFRTFTKLENIRDKRKLADAYARIGDCLYTKGIDYPEAVKNYQKSIDLKQGAEDKSKFYQAKVLELLDKKADRIKTLQDIVNNYPKSTYKVQSVYQIGATYASEKKYDKAIKYYQQLITDYPSSLQVKDALFGIANAKFGQQKFDESESYFKRILNEFDTNDTTICIPATRGLVDIYTALKQVDKINGLKTQYPCAKISDDLEENIYYDNAIQLYNEDKFTASIPELKTYLQKFPEGKFAPEMRGYLANAYYQTEDKENAIAEYRTLLEKPNNSFTEIALIRSSKFLYNNGDYENALPYYTRLEKITSSPEIIYNTRVGLMRTNFLLEKYSDASMAAVVVLDDKQISNEIEIEGNYIAGISFYKIQSYEDALTYLKWTSKNTGNIRGAEAQHYIAEVYFAQEEYKKAEKEHKALMKRKPAYDFWIAKSLILQAKVLMAQEELFQAKSTIELIINNYPITDDGILDEANTVKAEIEQLINTPKTEKVEGEQIIEINNEGGNNE